MSNISYSEYTYEQEFEDHIEWLHIMAKENKLNEIGRSEYEMLLEEGYFDGI